MRPHIAIIGSGPTAVYTAYYLLSQNRPLNITLYESQPEAGKGTPYHPRWNDASMLANIASIEIPPVNETLVAWLKRQPTARLARMGIDLVDIHDRAFYPRVTLGEYFHDQLKALAIAAPQKNHHVTIKTNNCVRDVQLQPDGSFTLMTGSELSPESYTHVVMATGHNLSLNTELRPGYFISPWPATALRTIGQCHIGIRGTSLSAIDAAVALAVARGTFRPEAGMLRYIPEPGTETFHITMMSRKGLLPEADFYHPIPYEKLHICTDAAIDNLIQTHGKNHLLDAVFALFKAELATCDPEYAMAIGLPGLTMEAFCPRYFANREQSDPFIWAAQNLAEAQANEQRQYTVAWRYAILRMHEPIGRAVRYLSAADHARFNRHFKHIFVDDYATVPHLSIQRLLALHEAGRLSVERLGENYTLDVSTPLGGAIVQSGGQQRHYPAFIDATGQRCLSAHDFPFPGLWESGLISKATMDGEEIGGIALDEYFRPHGATAPSQSLYCLSLPFLLAQFPFAQGITSSHDMGKVVAGHITAPPENIHCPKPHEKRVAN